MQNVYNNFWRCDQKSLENFKNWKINLNPVDFLEYFENKEILLIQDKNDDQIDSLSVENFYKNLNSKRKKIYFENKKRHILLHNLSEKDIFENIWAKKVFDSKIEAFFYKNKDWKKIRLRKTKYWFNMNFKEKIENKNFLENIEFEVNFDNFEQMEKILNWIWFEKYWYSLKNRVSFSLNNEIIFDFDKYENIPDLIEIEAKNEELVKKWLEILGYDLKDTVILTERGLKEKYFKK